MRQEIKHCAKRVREGELTGGWGRECELRGKGEGGEGMGVRAWNSCQNEVNCESACQRSLRRRGGGRDGGDIRKEENGLGMREAEREGEGKNEGILLKK